MKEMLETLNRIEDLLKVLVHHTMRDIFESELSDDKLRALYESTGLLSRDELVKLTGFSAGKISSLWQRWELKGMLVKEGSRYHKRF